MSRRTEQVEDLLRAELSDVLLKEIRDPRVRLASVAKVDVSPDLAHAKVSVSALSDSANAEEIADTLQHAAGFIRSRLASRLRSLRRIPSLTFHLDRGAEHSQRISDLLENLDELDSPERT